MKCSSVSFGKGVCPLPNTIIKVWNSSIPPRNLTCVPLQSTPPTVENPVLILGPWISLPVRLIGSTQNILFSVLLLSISKMFCVSEITRFVQLCVSVVCLATWHRNLSIHSPTDRCFECFQFGAIMEKPQIMYLQISYTYVFTNSGFQNCQTIYLNSFHASEFVREAMGN